MDDILRPLTSHVELFWQWGVGGVDETSVQWDALVDMLEALCHGKLTQSANFTYGADDLLLIKQNVGCSPFVANVD